MTPLEEAVGKEYDSYKLIVSGEPDDNDPICPCGNPIDLSDGQQAIAQMCETCLGDAQ